ncbi:YdeI/OmpD-associated family protein [Paraglaciecola aestuariivivens]
MSLKISAGLVHALPSALAQALETHQVISLWESLTAIGRNEFICWIESAKQDKTKAKRISRTIESLQTGKKRPCCWPGCIHRTDKQPSQWQQQVLMGKKSAPK